jgi:uncharacterized protein (TIGR00251 family)
LKSSPTKGKANKELITFLAKKLQLNKRQIEIIRGHKSRQKTVLITDSTLTHVEKMLE